MFIVFVAMVLAAFIRFRCNTSVNYLLIGSDGPYYPLQVRSLLENSRLAFPDMPLLFVVEAFFAKILQFLNITTYENCILWAVQFSDILLPPLAAIPVLAIAKELSNSKKISWLALLVVVFSVLNFVTIFAFMFSGLQKNALAVIWVFSYLYFVIRWLKKYSKTDFYKALIFLGLCVLTHFGCFSIMLGFTVVLTFFYFFYQKNKLAFLDFKTILKISSGLLGFLSILLLFDYQRLMRLLNLPFRLFEYPFYLCLMDGGFDLSPMSIFNMIFYNLLLFFALWFFFFNRKKLDTFTKILGSALITFGLLLSSPLLGIEWSNRLIMMTYVPITILYLLVFQAIELKYVKIIPALGFIGLIFFAIALGFKTEMNTCMTDEAFADLRYFKNKVLLSKNAVMTGRQHVRLLGNWVFGMKSCADYYLKKEDFSSYDAVYVLKQTNGDNLTSARFQQKPIPPNATLVLKSSYFELYQIVDTLNWNEGRGKPMVGKGRIININGDEIIIKNEKTNVTRLIYCDKKTTFELLNKEKPLQIGSYINVWGNRKVFSLSLQAETIKEVLQTE